MNKKAFGKCLKAFRIEKELSQEELAQALHVSQKTVSAWECGVAYPDLEVVEQICKELGITEQELFDSCRQCEKKQMGIVRNVAIGVAVAFLALGGFIWGRWISNHPDRVMANYAPEITKLGDDVTLVAVDYFPSDYYVCTWNEKLQILAVDVSVDCGTLPDEYSYSIENSEKFTLVFLGPKCDMKISEQDGNDLIVYSEYQNDLPTGTMAAWVFENGIMTSVRFRIGTAYGIDPKDLVDENVAIDTAQKAIIEKYSDRISDIIVSREHPTIFYKNETGLCYQIDFMGIYIPDGLELGGFAVINAKTGEVELIASALE